MKDYTTRTFPPQSEPIMSVCEVRPADSIRGDRNSEGVQSPARNCSDLQDHICAQFISRQRIQSTAIK